MPKCTGQKTCEPPLLELSADNCRKPPHVERRLCTVSFPHDSILYFRFRSYVRIPTLTYPSHGSFRMLCARLCGTVARHLRFAGRRGALVVRFHLRRHAMTSVAD